MVTQKTNIFASALRNHKRHTQAIHLPQAIAIAFAMNPWLATKLT